MKNQAENLINYHQFSKDLSRKFDEFIVKEISQRVDSETLKLLYGKFFKKKIGTVHQRVSLVFIAAKFFGIDTEKNFDKLMRLAAVPEILIWSEYAFNWVTDGKNNDSGTKYEENINLISSQYLLTEVTNFLPDRMLRRYLELYRWGIFGCLTVEKDLRITNWENMKEEKAFWTAYSRNHCIPDVGALYAYCFEIVHDYFELNLDQKFLDKINKISFEFGRGLQVNGDLSDLIIPNEFIATTEKRPQKDYFIDIRTDRLTYPSWLLLTRAEKDDKQLFKAIVKSAEIRKYPNSKFYSRIHNSLRKYGIVDEVLSFLNKEKKRLMKEINKLVVNNAGAELWKSSIIVLVNNKFRKQIKGDYSTR